MDRQKLVVWIFGFITLIVCSFFYFRSNRFVLQNEKGEISYKIDQWTGETWVLSGDQQTKVKDPDSNIEENKIVDKSTAITRVENANILSPYYTNEHVINSRLEDLSGSLNIIGWDAQKIDQQTFLVTYKYKLNDKLRGYHFEVNTKADIIRNVHSDTTLKKKYNIDFFDLPDKVKGDLTEKFLKEIRKSK